MSASYVDTAGRDWRLVVTVARVKRVRSELSFDPLSFDNSESGLLKVIADPVLLAGAIYHFAEPRPESIGVTAEQFGEGLAGNVIDEATRALLEALTDFFPNGGPKKILKAALDASSDLSAMNEKQIDDALAAFHSAIKADALTGLSIATTVPGSSELTPAG